MSVKAGLFEMISECEPESVQTLATCASGNPIPRGGGRCGKGPEAMSGSGWGLGARVAGRGAGRRGRDPRGN